LQKRLREFGNKTSNKETQHASYRDKYRGFISLKQESTTVMTLLNSQPALKARAMGLLGDSITELAWLNTEIGPIEERNLLPKGITDKDLGVQVYPYNIRQKGV